MSITSNSTLPCSPITLRVVAEPDRITEEELAMALDSAVSYDVLAEDPDLEMFGLTGSDGEQQVIIKGCMTGVCYRFTVAQDVDQPALPATPTVVKARDALGTIVARFVANKKLASTLAALFVLLDLFDDWIPAGVLS